MITIDYKDTRPIYEQVVEKFSQLILRGVLKADERMPSVRTLAMDISINPNTIQKAYAELERQGYIYTIKGRGNFVSNNKDLLSARKEKCLTSMSKMFSEAKAYGISMDEISRILSATYEIKE